MEKLFDFQFLFDVEKDGVTNLHVAYVGTTSLSSDLILDMCKSDAHKTYGNYSVVSFNYNVQRNEQKKD